MSEADQVLVSNAAYAASHDPLPDGMPSRRVAILTCMDARVDPAAMLGLAVGEAHVMRNAGGVLTDDMIRSLVVSQRMLGTEEIVLVHHSRCGLLGLDEDAFVASLEKAAGTAPRWRPGSFTDVDQDVRNAVAELRASPYLLHTDRIRGFVLDVETGLLAEVS